MIAIWNRGFKMCSYSFVMVKFLFWALMHNDLSPWEILWGQVQHATSTKGEQTHICEAAGSPKHKRTELLLWYIKRSPWSTEASTAYWSISEVSNRSVRLRLFCLCMAVNAFAELHMIVFHRRLLTSKKVMISEQSKIKVMGRKLMTAKGSKEQKRWDISNATSWRTTMNGNLFLKLHKVIIDASLTVCCLYLQHACGNVMKNI